jgi:hypothetical protein
MSLAMALLENSFRGYIQFEKCDANTNKKGFSPKRHCSAQSHLE